MISPLYLWDAECIIIHLLRIPRQITIYSYAITLMVQGNSIVIGNGAHTEVLIGGFNLTYMVETIQAMQETIDELKQKVIELQYQPGGPGYLESKDSFEKKQLKDVDSLDKNEQIK